MKSNIPYMIEDRFKELLDRDHVNDKDLERKSFFYIIAGNIELYKKVDYIYDFNKHNIKLKCLENDKVEFGNSSYKLMKLAFNLFDGYPADVLDTINFLNDEDFNLAIKGLRIRMNKFENNMIY